MKSFSVLLLLLLASCSSRPTTFAASSSPVPPGVRGTIPTQGSNCQYYLLGLIPISGSPDSQEALEDAKKRVDVDVLTDITIDYGGHWFILFSTNCVRVKGKGIPREVLKQADARENTR